MSELTVLLQGLQAARTELKNDLQRQVIKAVNDLVSLTINRVITTGLNSEGQSFTPYSTKPVAAWRYRGKSRTGGAEKKINEKAKRKEDVSYKEFRAINGLKSDKKIFEFTGEMWRHTGIQKVEEVGDFVIVTIGGKTETARKKLEGNSSREKINIAGPSASETKQVKLYLDKWIMDTIKRHT